MRERQHIAMPPPNQAAIPGVTERIWKIRECQTPASHDTSLASEGHTAEMAQYPLSTQPRRSQHLRMQE